MDGIHDLGGMHGFGEVEVEEDEPVFHHRWEGRTFALSALMSRALGANVDRFRHAIERLDPVTYLSAGYYGKWLRGLEMRLLEAGILGADELATVVSHLAAGGSSDELPLSVERVHVDATAPASDTGSRQTVFRVLDAEPRYRVGETVVARNLHPAGHTRLPRYARGRRGAVAAVYPGCVFPDTNAHGLGENPEYLYSVAFRGQELWGEDAEPSTTVYLDLFESYLEPSHG